MIKYTLSVFVIIIPMTCFAQEVAAENDFFGYSLNELMNITITTVSKEAESIKDAPSVVTVFTRKQIQQQGLKSVDEVLQRVPGFFVSRNREWQVIGSRGIVTQTNKQYLFLIDGHPNNSVIFTGFHNEQEYPTLDKVERIEIVRGPGSTLWGSDAILGVVNIITRSGDSFNGAELSVDYQQYFPINNKPRATVRDSKANASGDSNIRSYRKGKNKTVNLSYGTKLYDDVKGMFSFTFFDGQGYELDTEGPREAGFDMLMPREDWNNSWELYTKIQAGNLVIKARSVYAVDMDYRGSYKKKYYLGDKNAVIEDEWRLFWIETEHTKKLSADSVWINKLFTDSLYQNKAPKGGDTSRGTEGDRLYEERSYGFDSLYKLQLTAHKLKIGARFQRTDIGPMISAKLDYDPNTTGGYTTQDGKQYYRAPFAVDNAIGLFVEDRWLFSQKLHFVAGLRIDSNDLRDKKVIPLPRFSSIYQLDTNTTLKYMINTGYRRPSYWEYYRTSTKQIGTTASESNVQHDLQYLVSTKNSEFSLNPFYLKVEKYIDWITQKGNGNIGDITSFGIELDGKYYFKQGLSVYGNLAYSKVKVSGPEVLNVPPQISPDKKIYGMPRYIFNIGLDYAFSQRTSMNLHLRGWREMDVYNTLKYANGHGKLAGSHYLDFNLKIDRLFGEPVNIAVYAHNVFNNAQMLADTFKGGTIASEPLSIGIKLSSQFE